jgi:hypothetical protein
MLDFDKNTRRRECGQQAGNKDLLANPIFITSSMPIFN